MMNFEPNGLVQNAEIDIESTVYEHSSRLEDRIILFGQTIEKQQIIPEPSSVLEMRSSKMTRPKGRQNPYCLPKRPGPCTDDSYGNIDATMVLRTVAVLK